MVQLSAAEIKLLRSGLACFSISSKHWAKAERLSLKLLQEVEMLDLMNRGVPAREALPLVYTYKRQTKPDTSR
jgi:hypothetical protein